LRELTFDEATVRSDKGEKVWRVPLERSSGGRRHVLEIKGMTGRAERAYELRVRRIVSGTTGQGLALLLSTPVQREGVARVDDDAGSAWFFGGYSTREGGATGSFGDLWRLENSRWKRLSGDNELDVHGVYGAKGAFAEAYHPGARENAALWVDRDGAIWLFGGVGFGESGTKGYLNDLWKFQNGLWAWMGGSSSVNWGGGHETIDAVTSQNSPAGRESAEIWMDSASGALFVHGGNGYLASASIDFDDIWKFDGQDWTRLGGRIRKGAPDAQERLAEDARLLVLPPYRLDTSPAPEAARAVTDNEAPKPTGEPIILPYEYSGWASGIR
jgi:hypothetical protein